MDKTILGTGSGLGLVNAIPTMEKAGFGALLRIETKSIGSTLPNEANERTLLKVDEFDIDLRMRDENSSLLVGTDAELEQLNYSDNYSCGASCDGSCGMSCGHTCGHTCGNSCGDSCGNSCGSSCGSTCGCRD